MNAINRFLLLLVVAAAAAPVEQAEGSAVVRPTVIDASFSPDLSEFEPYSLVNVLQPDGKILVAGASRGYSGFRVTRLNEDGSSDRSFKVTDALNSLTMTNRASNLALLALEPDGKIFVAENLTVSGSNQVQGTSIIGLLSDGTLDTGFACELAKSLQNYPVLATLDVWADGRVFVAGDFSLVNGETQIAAALLKSDGTVDQRFDPAIFKALNGQASVADLTLQTDGKMLVGGSFISVAGVPRSYLARLNSDGSLDNAFSSAVGAMPSVTSVGLVRLQSDGKILVTATLTNLSAFGNPLATVARMNPDGALDESFHPAAEAQADWSIDSLRVKADGGVLIGGFANSQFSYRVLLLNSDGSLNRNLTAGLDEAGALSAWMSPLNPDSLNRLVGLMKFPTPPGNHLVPGDNLSAPRFGRYFSDVTIPGVEFEKNQFTVNETDGIGVINAVRTGDLTRPFTVRYATRAGTAQTSGRYLDRSGVLTFGSMEQSHSFTIPIIDDTLVNGDGTVLLELSEPSNGVVLSGEAKATLSIKDNEIATVVDPAFVPRLSSSSEVDAMIVQSDGKILLGGNLYVEDCCPALVLRLNPDGSKDVSFSAVTGGLSLGNAGCPSWTDALALQSDGKILVGGTFSSLQGTPKTGIARLNANGSLDPAFKVNLAGGGAGVYKPVAAIAVQPDGKILIGGRFSSVNGMAQGSIARILPDGTLDVTFTSPITFKRDSGFVYTITLQGDGKILITGYFDSLIPDGSNQFARLNPDGSPDESFPDAVASPILGQPDGKVVLSENGLVRWNSDGSVDPMFHAPLDTTGIWGLALGQDGRILVGLQHPGNAGATLNSFVRLNPDGSVHKAFPLNVTLDGGWTTPQLALLVDGTALVGGTFTSVSGVPRNGLAGLFLDGSSKTGVQFPTPSLAVAEDGGQATIVIERTGASSNAVTVGYSSLNGSAKAGNAFEASIGTVQFAPFETVKTIQIPIYDNLAAGTNLQFTLILTNASSGVLLDPGLSTQTVVIHNAQRPGSVDFSFDPGPNATYDREDTPVLLGVSTFATQANGKILLAGVFESLDGDRFTCLERLNSDGSSDASFDVIFPPDEGWGVSSSVTLLIVQPNAGILAGGDFEQINGVGSPRVVRLNPDGTRDGTFNATSVQGRLGAMALEADGRILCASASSRFGLANSLLRLHPDGSPDPSFDFGTGADGSVTSLLPQPDGKILIAGGFTQVQQTSRNGIARLDPEGGLDLSFDPGTAAGSSQVNPGTLVSSIALAPDDRILVLGAFDKFNGIPRFGLVRLNPDGSVDPTFSNQTHVETSAGAIAIQPDGRILLGGEMIFDTKIGRTSLARLNPDGTLDRSFDPGDGATDANGPLEPKKIALQADGHILALGNFYWFDGVPRAGIVRLHGDPPLRFLRASSAGIGTFTLGTLPGRNYLIEGSADLRNWAPLRTNSATDFVSKWTDPVTPPPSQRFYRAREFSP
jgi:uncharacterized delta-60 repeat protein